MVGGLAVFGIASSAQAAPITTVSITTASTLYKSTTNASDINVSFTLPTAVPANAVSVVRVYMMSGSWTNSVTDGAACGASATVTSSESTLGTCTLANNGPNKGIKIAQVSGASAGSTWTFVFKAQTVTMPNSSSMMLAIESVGPSGSIDSTYQSVAVSNPPAGATVTFDANGGTGSMTNQTASAGTALTANSFTRTGYTFSGWNTVANGSGTAYANSSTSYPFTSNGTLYAQWTANGGGGSSASANLTLNATTGQLVAGSTVAVAASGLQTSAPYTVVVQSTPQTIGSGNATSGAVNTSVTLPSGLEAGWHTLTFNSTASDGSTITSVTYFKVSASGTLLATSSTIPAELANTGVNPATGISLLVGGLSLALVGAEMFIIARRKALKTQK